MAVAHRASAASGSVNPTTSMTITIPASVQTGDLLICAFTSRDHTNATAFATCTDNDTGGNTWLRFWHSDDRKANLFWKIATSATASKTITVGSCVGSCSGGVSAYSGQAAIGLAIGDFTAESNASADETHASFTPVSNDNEICFAVFNYGNDNAVTSVAGATVGALNSRFEKLSTGGSDCATTLWSLAQGTAGATGSITWAQTNGTTYSVAFSIVSTEVTFPNTSILDSFTRADQNPLVSPWASAGVYVSVGQNGRVVSNQLAAGALDAHPYWDTAFNADQEGYITFPNRSGFTIMNLLIRGAQLGVTPSNHSYYSAEIRASDEFRFIKAVNEVETILVRSVIPVANGDAIGMRAVGDRISVWKKPSGGSWGKIFMMTDSSVTAGGKVGLMCSGSSNGTIIGDDFGGGNYSVGGVNTTNFFRLF